MDGAKFCGHCGVSWFLHPDPASRTPEPWECDSALEEADKLDEFWQFGNARLN